MTAPRPVGVADESPASVAGGAGGDDRADDRHTDGWPNCLEVVAMAAATPACSRGIPETAALVIESVTKPNPIPKTT